MVAEAKAERLLVRFMAVAEIVLRKLRFEPRKTIRQCHPAVERLVSWIFLRCLRLQDTTVHQSAEQSADRCLVNGKVIKRSDVYHKLKTLSRSDVYPACFRFAPNDQRGGQLGNTNRH